MFSSGVCLSSHGSEVRLTLLVIYPNFNFKFLGSRGRCVLNENMGNSHDLVEFPHGSYSGVMGRGKTTFHFTLLHLKIIKKKFSKKIFEKFHE